MAQLKIHVDGLDAEAWFEERLGKNAAVTFEDRPLHETGGLSS